jgi:hypothetical protein
MTKSDESNTIDIGQTLVNLGHHLENLPNTHPGVPLTSQN